MIKFKNSTNKNLIIFGLIFFAFSISAKIYTFAKMRKSEDPQTLLEFVVNEQNKILPKDITPDLRLEKTSYEPNLVYVVNYTFKNDSSKTTTQQTLEDNLSKSKPTLCKDPVYMEFFKNGIKVKFAYHNKEGKLMGQSELTPEKCKLPTTESK